jgi:hypothetical protein
MDRPADYPPVPDEAIGLWRRAFKEMEDGSADRTTRVFYGQSRNLFIDIRIPIDRPAARAGQGVESYSLEELARIAKQQAFAGHAVIADGRCTWHRTIDYQPRTGRPDSSLIEIEGDELHERGDASSVTGMNFYELYHRECRGQDRRLAFRLAGSDGAPFGGRPARDAFLVVLDDRFWFARPRPRDLGMGKSLPDLVREAGDDRAAIEACLDCEISLGRLGEGERAWRIELSTLPWREGERLFQRGRATFDGTSGMLRQETQAGWADWRLYDSNLGDDAIRELFAS